MAFKFNPFTGNFDIDNDAQDLSSKANVALDNLASVAINTSLISDTDSTDDLGSSSKYWANGYIDKIYLNATASLAGATGGQIDLVGNLYGSTTSIIRSLNLHAYGANASIKLTNTNDGTTTQGFMQSTYWSMQFGYIGLTGDNQTGLYLGRPSGNGKTHAATIHKLDILTVADLGNILDDGDNNMTIRGTTTHGGTIASDTDSTDDLGTSSIYWANGYIDKLTVGTGADIQFTTDHMSINKGAGAGVYLFEGAVSGELPVVRIYGYGAGAGSLGYGSLALTTYNQFNIVGSEMLYEAANHRFYGGNIELGLYAADNLAIMFGAANDASIYYDGTHLQIDPKLVGSGGVEIRGNVGFNSTTPIAKPTVTGSRGANAALASLLTALANYGLITDSSS